MQLRSMILFQTGVVRNQVAKSGDTIYCRFQRPARMTITRLLEREPPTKEIERTFDINTNQSYIFLGWGSVYEGGGNGKKYLLGAI